MKKFFIKETDEVVEYGDVIQISFNKVLEDGEVNVEKEIKLSPATIVMLLELGIIEEKDVEDNNLIDFSEEDDEVECPFGEILDEIIEETKKINKKISKLEEKTATLEELYRLQKPEKTTGKK